MAASVQFRPQNRDLGVVMREVDDDLAIFLGMQSVEKEINDDSKGEEPKHDTSLTSDPLQPDNVQISADDNLLNMEIEKNDYDWLISQPDTSLLPSVEIGVQDCEVIVSNSEAISLKSKLTNTSEECAPVGDTPLQPPTSTNQRPSSSSRDRKPNPGRPIVPAKSKGSRSSTPTSRPTSISRPSIPVISSKSALRSSTPTRKPSTPTPTPGVSSTVRSSSGRKTGPVMKNPVPSRGTSPTVRSRPSKPSDMLSLSHDATQIPKISMPKRPSSASRGRPSGPATNLPSSNVKPRQKSCSPAKVRVPNTNVVNKSGSKMISRSRGYINGEDDVNPVLMGTKMVERVVNMRKLAPPKQDEYNCHDNVKKSDVDKGFGRSLSKKSLDMAIRHMDIRRSISNDLRPVGTGFQSGSGKSSSFDVSSSQTSSTDSSKSSIINSYFLNRND